MKVDRAKELHKKCIFLDGCAATYPKDFNAEYIQKLKEAGISATHVTIPDVECFSVYQVVDQLAKWFHNLRRLVPYKVRLVTTVKSIRETKDEGGVAMILGSQGSGFLGVDLSSLDLFARLGMRTMQPTYQRQNQFGSGCGEKTDSGLSDLGIQWVQQMNELRMVISLSHASYKTSMQVMEITKDPVIFDHSNPKALCDHPRNITDEQMRVCAEKSGVIGLCPLVEFTSADKKASEQNVEDYVKHIDYVVDLIGIDHVGIGLDFAESYFYTPELILEEKRLYPGLESRPTQEVDSRFLESGNDKLYFYERHLPWLRTISDAPIVTEALLHAGYSEEDVKKIIGENFLRVFKAVWGN
jgi:membrane dipeptidase